MTIFIAIGVLLVVALVMFFMFRTKPKKPEKTIVAITPPSGGGIAETYIEFANPTIEVTGLTVTLPEDYGEWTYNDGTKKTAELTRMVLELRQGDEVLGNIVYERDTADPPLADWYIEHEEGQSPKAFTVALRDNLENYVPTDTSPLKAFVSFTNDPKFEATPETSNVTIDAPERFQTGTGAITGGGITGGTASYIGAPTGEDGALTGDYILVDDLDNRGEWWAPIKHVPSKPPGGFSLDQCKEACDAYPSCTKIAYTADLKNCYLYASTANLVTSDLTYNLSYKAYEKSTS